MELNGFKVPDVEDYVELSAFLVLNKASRLQTEAL